MKKGNIGVTTENIFPIIKKFLYSDHEIFLRELVSNAVDATRKLQTLASVGQFKGELGDLTIRISVDEAKHTLTISDSGVGMSIEEVDKYINQIAFSGAEEFMEKYKNQSIIGHFGLGFYSSFMVADRVEILTRSCAEDSKTVEWSCEGNPEYELGESKRERARGTDIVLHLSKENHEFADASRIAQMLDKYCRFLPIPIAFGKKKEWKEGKMVETDEEMIINDTNPLWTRKPTEIKPEEYDAFYQKLYAGSEQPLFNIHLNIDYPFNLTGILYFPRIRNNFELRKDRIQLYSNQVFVTDSVEGIVPEFLTMLHGVIDSPDIPLNVSRSYLQSDSNVKKISSYITRKVADRLMEIFTNQREEFESKWDDLKIFIQYGIVTDEKFSEKAADFVLLKNTAGKYFTLADYRSVVEANQTDKNNDLIYLYTTDPVRQHSFVEAAIERGYDVLVMDGQLDSHFINWFEHKNDKVRFARVDADLLDKLIRKETDKALSLTTLQQDELRPVFESQLPADQKVHYDLVFEAMEPSQPPVMIVQNEFSRRMKEMAQGGGGGMASFYANMPDSFTVAVNGNHPLVVDVLEQAEQAYGDKLKSINKKVDAAVNEEHLLDEVLRNKKEADLSPEERTQQDELRAKVEKLRNERSARFREVGAGNALVKQLVDLALLSNGMLSGESLTNFIRRSVDLLNTQEKPRE